MENSESDSAAKVRKLVDEFNTEVQSSDIYRERKKALTTPTVFFDGTLEFLPGLTSSPDGWCTLPSDLAALAEQSQQGIHVM